MRVNKPINLTRIRENLIHNINMFRGDGNDSFVDKYIERVNEASYLEEFNSIMHEFLTDKFAAEKAVQQALLEININNPAAIKEMSPEDDYEWIYKGGNYEIDEYMKPDYIVGGRLIFNKYIWLYHHPAYDMNKYLVFNAKYFEKRKKGSMIKDVTTLDEPITLSNIHIVGNPSKEYVNEIRVNDPTKKLSGEALKQKIIYSPILDLKIGKYNISKGRHGFETYVNSKWVSKLTINRTLQIFNKLGIRIEKIWVGWLVEDNKVMSLRSTFILGHYGNEPILTAQTQTEARGAGQYYLYSKYFKSGKGARLPEGGDGNIDNSGIRADGVNTTKEQILTALKIEDKPEDKPIDEITVKSPIPNPLIIKHKEFIDDFMGYWKDLGRGINWENEDKYTIWDYMINDDSSDEYKSFFKDLSALESDKLEEFYSDMERYFNQNGVNEIKVNNPIRYKIADWVGEFGGDWDLNRMEYGEDTADAITLVLDFKGEDKNFIAREELQKSIDEEMWGGTLDELITFLIEQGVLYGSKIEEIRVNNPAKYNISSETIDLIKDEINKFIVKVTKNHDNINPSDFLLSASEPELTDLTEEYIKNKMVKEDYAVVRKGQEIFIMDSNKNTVSRDEIEEYIADSEETKHFLNKLLWKYYFEEIEKHNIVKRCIDDIKAYKEEEDGDISDWMIKSLVKDTLQNIQIDPYYDDVFTGYDFEEYIRKEYMKNLGETNINEYNFRIKI